MAFVDDFSSFLGAAGGAFKTTTEGIAPLLNAGIEGAKAKNDTATANKLAEAQAQLASYQQALAQGAQRDAALEQQLRDQANSTLPWYKRAGPVAAVIIGGLVVIGGGVALASVASGRRAEHYGYEEYEGNDGESCGCG